MHNKLVPILIAFCCAGAAHAHHGVANFDLNADVEITGVVSRVDLINPHSWLYIDVTGDNGQVETWRCEMRGVTVLMRSGWTAEMFPVGTEVTVTGSPDRRVPRTCYLGTAVFPDGSSVDRYGQIERNVQPPAAGERPSRLANGDPNIAGDWAAEQRVMTDPRGQSGALVPISTADQFEPGAGRGFPGARGTDISLAEDPVDAYWNQRPSALPLTEAGAAVMADFDGSSTDNPRLRCAPTNILWDWTFEADINRITQTADEIKMYYGSMGIERTIHLNMQAHPEAIEGSVAGHSIGRWEDDVLVVDTIGFLPGILLADGRVPHSDQLHVVERFSLDPDTMALSRSYVAEDPLYFVGAYRGADSVYPSELPYHGTTQCDDRTQRGAGDSTAPAAAADGERRWFDFLRFWD